MENNTQTNTEVNNQADDNIPVDLSDQQTIDLFIEGLLEEKGVVGESEQMHEDMFVDLKNRLLEEIDRALISELPDDQLEEISNMVIKDGKVDPQIVAERIEAAGIDTETVIGATMANFREIYLNNGAAETEQ